MRQLYNARDLWVANRFCQLTVPKYGLPNTVRGSVNKITVHLLFSLAIALS